MKIKNLKNFVSGLLFTSIGLAFLFGAMKFPMGSVTSMGPGFFPFVVSTLVVVLGALILVRSLYVK